MKSRVLRKVEWTASEECPRPDVSFMPMMERRRLSLVERAALHVAWRVFNDPEAVGGVSMPAADSVPVVFASRWGEIGTTLKLMRQMHGDGEMSPAAFSASVHNAAPGAWSLFTKNKSPYTAIAARDRTYEMGLLEAEAQLAAGPYRSVLYVYAEESTPAYYGAAFPKHEHAHATALFLTSNED
ncbi:MAG: hypothetical protein E7046_03225 [Lentisphaerae bacterium]|nr:hypothetical protein [Lentisphaerota bacterium]